MRSRQSSKIEFEDGSSAPFCLADPGSSVAVRDKNHANISNKSGRLVVCVNHQVKRTLRCQEYQVIEDEAAPKVN
jgi:hypothetical protein